MTLIIRSAGPPSNSFEADVSYPGNSVGFTTVPGSDALGPFALRIAMRARAVLDLGRMSVFGAERKLGSEVGSFRFAPIVFSNGSRTAARCERY